jgi:peroxiredoxin
MHRWERLALLLGVLAWAGACASDPPPRSQPSRLLSNVLPAFESKTLNGLPLDTGTFYGHTLVVSFVSSRCAPCEKTLVADQALYSDFHDVVVVGVFNADDASSAAQLISKHELRFPVVLDRDGAIAKRYDIERVPVTFVADDQGRVRWVGGSEMTSDGLIAAVRATR